MTKLTWTREPFYGGCSYYGTPDYDPNFAAVTVTGHYSPSEFFEADCRNWEASNIPDANFATATEAMHYAEVTYVFSLKDNT